MNSSYHVLDTQISTPEQFEATIMPMAGRVTVSPYRGTQWHGTLRAARLPRVGTFALRADAMHVQHIDLPRSFYGVTLPLNASFAVSEARQVQTYDRDSAHVLYPDREFDFRATHRTGVLVANFFIDDLNDYARRLEGGVDSSRAINDPRISLATPTGSGLLRYLSFVWSELNRGGGILNSDLVATEIEDGLIAALVWAMEEQRAAEREGKASCTDRRFARVEQYLLAHLCEPVSRAALAEVAGVSIRTLSRGFLKRHGVGPMAFLRQRRLEAARAELLIAEPGTTSVSVIAGRYGFSELSKFSAAYKAAFGELPSETLRR